MTHSRCTLRQARHSARSSHGGHDGNMRSAFDNDEIDYFELFCVQAGRRLSSASAYGGSLPSLCSRGKAVSRDAGDKPPSTLCLHVPEWPQIRRSRSDGGDGRDMLCTSPKARHKPWPLKLLSSITCLSDSCDSHELSPPPLVTICRSAPHSRSSSVKRKRRARLVDTDDGMRPRTSSMPTRNNLQKPGSGSRLLPDDADEWDRVRNFVTTAKGVVNCGDSFRNKSCSSIQSLYNCDTCRRTPTSGVRDVDALRLADERVPRQRVLLLGAAGVGKSTIAQQFLTSVCLVNGSEDSSVSVSDIDDSFTVTVLLNEEETTLEISEKSCDEGNLLENADAYVIVYCTNDRMSFHRAVDILYRIRKEEARENAIILVANKTDLVRNREVAEQEGKAIADTYDCKYIEVSALINVKVDDLLAGIISQIHLRQHSCLSHSSPPAGSNGRRSPIRLIGRLFGRHSFVSRSCDNLLVP